MNSAFIAIEGPIGVGKSALMDALEKEYGKQILHSFREEREPNPFLEKFYEDKRKYAFQTQIAFMLSRYKQYEELQKSLRQPDMFDSKLHVSDFIFEKNDIFAELTIEDEREWKLYQKMRDILLESSKKFTNPNFVVYLRAGEEILYRRVKNKLRQTEQLRLKEKDNSDKGITKDYLHKLTALYDRYFFHYKSSPVLIIDVNNIDFVHKPSPVASIISSIKKAIDTPLAQNTYIKLE
jgi:deoxyadenosine/deoxycytidine kinase